MAVALALCALGAHGALVLLRLAAVTEAGRARAGWCGLGALTFGIAAWATHFLAMLAFRPGVPAAYDLLATLASLVVVVLVTAAGFLLALNQRLPLPRVQGGLVVALGVAAMHHLGMAGYEPHAVLDWDGTLLGLSIAAGAAFLAGGLHLAHGQPERGRLMLGATLLVLGVGAIHFIGMAAMTLLPVPLPAPGSMSASDAGTLAVFVGSGALVLLGLCLFAALLAERSRRHLAEEAERVRALADAAVEGLLVCEGERVVLLNRSARALIGAGAGPAEGADLRALLPDPESVGTLLRDGERRCETELAGASGPVPVEIVARSIEYRGRPHRVLALRDLRDRRQAERRIRYLSRHDPLTGLGNRASFSERLGRAIAEAEPRGGGFALFALDLDRFQAVNDTRGHAAGDALLAEAAQRLRAALGEHGAAFRLGGDEFAVIQREADQDGAEATARRIVALLARPFAADGRPVETGVSIGIAVFPRDGGDVATLARNANLALQRAKAEGRGRHRFFEAATDATTRHRHSLALALRGALPGGQLRLVYQPQLDLRSGAISGFEALLRWDDPERGLVSPTEFIPLAEESGLIHAIGEWALREACREAVRWEGSPTLAVNLSAVQLREPGLPGLLRSACAEAGLDPGRLELEITEGTLLSDGEGTMATLRAFKALGIRTALDDFGTGYSSLAYLRRFPFDTLKIDRSFLAEAARSEGDAAILRAIIGLGRNLGLSVTAEGVETEAQLAQLRAEGCDKAQGYLIGRPLPAAQARLLLAPGDGDARRRACGLEVAGAVGP